MIEITLKKLNLYQMQTDVSRENILEYIICEWDHLVHNIMC